MNTGEFRVCQGCLGAYWYKLIFFLISTRIFIGILKIAVLLANSVTSTMFLNAFKASTPTPLISIFKSAKP